MAQIAKNHQSEQVGLFLGRAWRALQRSRARAERWLLARGVGREAANILIIGLSALSILVLLSIGFFFALGALVVVACLLFLGPEMRGKTREPEWRDGPLGFGLYDSNDMRVDAHDPRDER